jgi:hypothetical protein
MLRGREGGGLVLGGSLWKGEGLMDVVWQGCWGL